MVERTPPWERRAQGAGLGWRERRKAWQLETVIVHRCACGWSATGRLGETLAAFEAHECGAEPRHAGRGRTPRVGRA